MRKRFSMIYKMAHGVLLKKPYLNIISNCPYSLIHTGNIHFSQHTG